MLTRISTFRRSVANNRVGICESVELELLHFCSIERSRLSDQRRRIVESRWQWTYPLVLIIAVPEYPTPSQSASVATAKGTVPSLQSSAVSTPSQSASWAMESRRPIIAIVRRERTVAVRIVDNARRELSACYNHRPLQHHSSSLAEASWLGSVSLQSSALDPVAVRLGYGRAGCVKSLQSSCFKIRHSAVGILDMPMRAHAVTVGVSNDDKLAWCRRSFSSWNPILNRSAGLCRWRCCSRVGCSSRVRRCSRVGWEPDLEGCELGSEAGWEGLQQPVAVVGMASNGEPESLSENPERKHGAGKKKESDDFTRVSHASYPINGNGKSLDVLLA